MLWSYKLDLVQNISSINKTYFQASKSNNQVISDHTIFLKNKFEIEVDEENKKPPKNSWILNFINILLKPGL